MTHKDKVLTYALYHCMEGFTAPDAARAAGCTTQHAYKTLSSLRVLRRKDAVINYRGRSLLTVCYYVAALEHAEALAVEVESALTCTVEEAQQWITS